MQRTTEQMITAALQLERPPPELDDSTLTHEEVLLAAVQALNTPHAVWIPITDDLWVLRDRYQHEYPSPNDYEQHLLVMLMEECAEITQRASKILRFGQGEREPGQFLDNATRLAQEIGDLQGVIDLLIRADLVPQSTINHARRSKPFRMEAFPRRPAE